MRSIKNIFQVTFLLATLFLFAPQVYANPLGDKEVALFKAIEESDMQRVESLLDQGVDLEVRDDNETTPLMAALMYFIMGTQDSQIMEALINAGADVNLASGDPLLHHAVAFDIIAANSDSPEVKDILIQLLGIEEQTTVNSITPTPQNSIKAVEILVNAGADIEETNSNAMSVLQAAIIVGSNKAMIETLIENGANVNPPDIPAWMAIPTLMPPLMMAIMAWRTEIIEILISAGADVKIRSISGETFLHPVANTVDPETPTIIEMLVNAGIDVNAENDRGETALSLAKEANNVEAVTTLLRLGAVEK